MDKAFEQARALATAHKNAESYHSYSYSSSAATSSEPHHNPSTMETSHNNNQNDQGNLDNDDIIPFTAAINNKCYFCGRRRHPRESCPASWQL